MNAVDIAILVVLAVLLAKGLWLGLVHELCTLAGLAGGTILAIRYRDPLSHVFQGWVKLEPELLGTLAATVLFLATLATCMLIGMLLSRVLKLLFLGGFNRVLGGLFGLVQGVLLLTLLLYGLSLTSWLRESRQNSRLAPPFVTLGEQLLGKGQLLPR
jgi:membrane protein required for colicin V production